MRFLYSVLLMLGTWFSGKAQSTTIVTNYYTFPNGWTINEGDSLKIGKPSEASGFKFITRKRSQLGPEYASEIVVVRELVKTTEKSSTRITATVRNDNINSYQVDFINAARTGEIDVPEGATLTKPAPYDPEKFFGLLPLKDGRVFYEGIVTVDSTSKQVLYQRAKRWVVDAYKSTKDVIQLDDPESGELVLKGKFETYWASGLLSGEAAYIDHKISISVKDGKYRYQMMNFVANGYHASTSYNVGGPWNYPLESWIIGKNRPQYAQKYVREQLYPRFDGIIKSLKEAMSEPTPAKQDW